MIKPLFILALIVPFPVLYSSHFSPDFVVRYVNVDPNAVKNVEFAFLEGFESPPIAPKSFCYVDFATAEDYRRYRNSSRYENPPSFLGNVTPRNEHQYFVKVRDPGRLRIMYERIDLAKSRGFYGVFLDLADYYVYRLDEYPDAYERFVYAIENVTVYAHSIGLKVVVNIGSALRYAYDLNVDGILREVVYFYMGEPVDEEYVSVVLEALYAAKSRGLWVFVVDEAANLEGFMYAYSHLRDFYTFITDGDYDHMPRRYEGTNKYYFPFSRLLLYFSS